ncbi:MAG: NAD(+)/NADH kinase [Candidatus Aenigmarchaeota archaeon]|nr:NAD(+)/NADH kinase [Candidatus Aenigmarchaeota archaeon]
MHLSVAVVGKNRNILSAAEMGKYGLKLSKKPKYVIAIGGDGSLLYSERAFPSLPKFFINHKCAGCKKHDFSSLLKKLRKGVYKKTEILKLETTVKRRKLRGINEIAVHFEPPSALRFEVFINSKSVGKAVGDGVVVSTPLGSNAYFHSITRKSFSSGIGIAFNNSIEKIKPKTVSEQSKIEIRITRGIGRVFADNNPNPIWVSKGDRIVVKKSSPAFLLTEGKRHVFSPKVY